MVEFHKFSVCECCLLAIANGDPCDCLDGHDEKVTKGLDRLAADGYWMVAGNNEEGFSWRPCELGGNRHEAFGQQKGG
jgi:hypothetical protein